jgi:hypothetical protein
MTWLLRIIRCPNSAHIDGTLVPVEEVAVDTVIAVKLIFGSA